MFTLEDKENKTPKAIHQQMSWHSSGKEVITGTLF